MTFFHVAVDDYMAVGLGIGGSEAPKEEHRKSLSTERTFNTISRDADLFTKLRESSLRRVIGDPT
jgi:hypothetical protein